MARYYFHLRHGPGPDGLAVDLEGNDLPDLTAARAHALAAARDLIARTRSHSVRDWFACAFEITDAGGELLSSVPFGETVRDGDGDE